MRSFLIWAAALVLLRSLLVLSLGDAFFYGEELEKATAGKAMLDGLGIPHHKLAYHYYEGGGFVVSHMKAAAFMVFGESILANKAVALFSCLAVLWAGWWACGKAFGNAAGHVFCALYVFAPAAVQKLSMISLGIHHEACFFVLIALGLTALLLERQNGKEAFLLGLTLGFGVYFSWVVALAAASCAISLLIRWRQGLDGAAFFACLGGVLIGLTPMFLMVQEVGSAVLDIHGTGLGDSAARSTSETLREFLRSIYVEGALGGFLAELAWPSAVVGAVIFGVRRDWAVMPNWRRSFFSFALFPAIFIAAYLSSAFVQGRVYHFFLMLRLVPLWVVGATLIAAVVGRSFKDHGAANPTFVCCAALLVIGAINSFQNLGAISPRVLSSNFDLLTRERGYVYPSYFAKLIPHLEGDVDGRLRTLLRFKDAPPELLREGIAAELFRRKHGAGISLEDDYIAARDVVERVEPGRFGEYARGLGPLLVDWFGADLPSALSQVSAAGDDAALLGEALGRTGSGFRSRGADPSLEGIELMLIDDLKLVADDELSMAFARGVGWRLHWILHRTVLQPWRAAEVFEAAPSELRESFEAGYEEARLQGLIVSQP